MPLGFWTGGASAHLTQGHKAPVCLGSIQKLPTSLYLCAPYPGPSPSLAWTNVVRSSLVSWLLFRLCSESSMASTSLAVKA